MIHSVADARKIASRWYEGQGHLYEFVSTGTLSQQGVYAWYANLQDVENSKYRVEADDLEELRSLISWIEDEWDAGVERMAEDHSFKPED